MNRLRSIFLFPASLVLLTAVGSLINSHHTAARADGGPVITIGGPVPLPVTAPVPLKVTGDTTVSGTVTVGNTALLPVPTRSLDNPALQPVQFFQAKNTATSTSPDLLSFPVPSGKRLVIEYVSIECLVPQNVAAIPLDIRLSSVVNGVVAQYFFAPAILPPVSWIVNQTTRIYADGGTVVSISSGTAYPTGSNCGASISGYFVNPL